ncbi:MAG: hypothetical protein WCD44_01250, partial [Candidatus Babeliales bacterium]
FLLEKKEKKLPRMSINVLREECLKDMGDIMQIVPAIMREFADIQSILLTHIYAFLDNEKCFLLSAKKEELADLNKKLTFYGQELRAIKRMLHEQVLSLSSLDADAKKVSDDKPKK